MVVGAQEPVELDYALVAALDDRPREAVIEELFRSEYAGLLRLATCIVGDRCSAEDVVMEAFASLHVHWSGMRRSSAPLPYLRSSVILGSRSVIRRMVRERRRRSPSEVGWPDPNSAAAIAADESDTLTVAVRSLPTRQREVIVCRYYLELSEAETAVLLGLSLGSVKQHAHRARLALSARLEVVR